MLPLGDLWTGRCVAGDQPFTPDDPTLHRLCNLGYARGACRDFPNALETPDAVRFTISGQSGDVVQLYYVIERDHRPFAHGRLDYSVAQHTLCPGSAPGASLARQAEAYADSYLRRKES